MFKSDTWSSQGHSSKFHKVTCLSSEEREILPLIVDRFIIRVKNMTHNEKITANLGSILFVMAKYIFSILEMEWSTKIVYHEHLKR